ncbi:hypothetical protein ACHHYP_06054 [Achlya hypogyna]|uniref:Elicitin n=1 Tax=Achlya hypogyna TaxID=1202772 RepID=A0A0A7CMD9_ACHHY|nr:secreted protein [Achlya hypogyna]OQR89783.1 hypothetical protein ACHHYP_06054 [Achlya hypogyna]
MHASAILVAALIAVATAHGDEPHADPKMPCTEAQTANVTKWFTTPINPGCTLALSTVTSPLQLVGNMTDADLLKICGNKDCMTYIHDGLHALPSCVATVGTQSGNANAALDAAHDKCHSLMHKDDNMTSGHGNSTSGPAITTVPGNKTTTPAATSGAARASITAIALTAVATVMMN